MRKIAISLSTCMAMALGLPFAAHADDAQYCQALVAKYRAASGGTQNNQAVAEAMDQCSKGNTAPAIPVLEKALKDARVTLPLRT